MPKEKFRLEVGKTKNIASTTTTNSFPCQWQSKLKPKPQNRTIDTTNKAMTWHL